MTTNNKDEILQWFNKLLTYSLHYKASDLHINSGAQPRFRMGGRLAPLKDSERVRPETVERVARAITSPKQWEAFEENHELDLGYGLPGKGRFRINIYMQRSTMGIAVRAISTEVPDFESLNLPPVISSIAETSRGLVLVTGATSSGKSTTLASMVDYINRTREAHIITIEDPIEYLFKDKNSLITQREIGMDTYSFANALKAALRQDPDVILIGEMRDLETIEIALSAAETGHLVLTTLHTTDAYETINRIMATFPKERQDIARVRLAGTIKAVITQRLVPCMNGDGRTLAVEVMINTAHVRDLILDPQKTIGIPEAIAEGGVSYGMQSFDQSLMQLVRENKISYNTALDYASNPSDFALHFQGIGDSSGDEWMDMGSGQGGSNQGGNDGGGGGGLDDDFLSDEFDLD